jgi:prevent-host-death family protein
LPASRRTIAASRFFPRLASVAAAGRHERGGSERPLITAIFYGYNFYMDVSVAETKNRLPELIRAVEQGEKVVITRHGKPVAQIAPPPPERRKVRLGGMKNRIKLLPGWNAPISLDRFLKGEF